MDLSNTIVFGANGGIGNALVRKLSERYPTDNVYAISRNMDGLAPCSENVVSITSNFSASNNLEQLSGRFSETKYPINGIIVASGVLTAVASNPEKSANALSEAEMLENYRINSIIPALIFKYFHRMLSGAPSPFFAVLSARIGSISDNRLGGWYSYRMAKSALNMFVRTASIEFSRINRAGVVLGLHPGTVNTAFTERYVKNRSTFSPETAAENLVSVLSAAGPSHTGQCLAYDGSVIQP
jgi:NAD(P)-dependent dehydrogenase (short-subunit alcohol dehydrogenase family)